VDNPENSRSGRWSRFWGLRHRLPFKLLAVTVFGVLMAEIVIFIPSVANHRAQLLQQRLDAAHLSALTMQIAPRESMTPERVRDILSTADILGVSVYNEGRSQLVLAPDLNPEISNRLQYVDLANSSPLDLVTDALGMMFSRDNAYLLVHGRPSNMQDVMVEMVIQRRPMRLELWGYARSIFWLSLFVSVMAAAVLYFALMAILVRPMVRLTRNMSDFQEHPEDASRMMRPSLRRDEIGDAEKVLAQMQAQIRASLKQRARLATLGEGVSKISHDLRNVLTSAVLMSDRLMASDDPRVQKLAPRLVQALDRAVALSRATLDYGRVEDISLEEVNLFDIVEEVDDSLNPLLCQEPRIRLVNEVSPDVTLRADFTHFFRAMANLVRNAAEALRGVGHAQGRITISAKQEADRILIHITDNGPGVPEEAREDLFVPFKGSSRKGGTGLGLAIAYETIIAHGGRLRLAKTDAEGTVFEIDLPR